MSIDLTATGKRIAFAAGLSKVMLKVYVGDRGGVYVADGQVSILYGEPGERFVPITQEAARRVSRALKGEGELEADGSGLAAIRGRSRISFVRRDGFDLADYEGLERDCTASVGARDVCRIEKSSFVECVERVAWANASTHRPELAGVLLAPMASSSNGSNHFILEASKTDGHCLYLAHAGMDPSDDARDNIMSCNAANESDWSITTVSVDTVCTLMPEPVHKKIGGIFKTFCADESVVDLFRGSSLGVGGFRCGKLSVYWHDQHTESSPLAMDLRAVSRADEGMRVIARVKRDDLIGLLRESEPIAKLNNNNEVIVSVDGDSITVDAKNSLGAFTGACDADVAASHKFQCNYRYLMDIVSHHSFDVATLCACEDSLSPIVLSLTNDVPRSRLELVGVMMPMRME